MFFKVTHRFIHDPRVPTAPATGSTKSTPPQGTFPKSPRSRGTATLQRANADNVGPAPATLAPSPSSAPVSVPTPTAAPDSVADQPAPRQPSRPTPLGPAASARSSAPSAPDCAPHEKSTRANCPSASPGASDETAPEKPPERPPRHDPPSTRSTERIAATGCDIRQTTESLRFRPQNTQSPAPRRRIAPTPKESQIQTLEGS